MFVVKRRELLLGVLALSTFPKVVLSDQSTIKYMMRSQLLGSNEAPIKIKEFSLDKYSFKEYLIALSNLVSKTSLFKKKRSYS